MRRKYESPVFVAEEYTFNDTIAKTCDFKVDNNTVLQIDTDTSLCSIGDKGHNLGGQQDTSGKIVKVDFGGHLPPGATIYLFNNHEECDYKWAGPGTNVTRDGYNFGSFADAMFGNSATDSGHAPAYEMEIFFS